MSRQQRAQRLQADLQALQELQDASRIMTFEGSGEPPDRYRLAFAGRGIARVSALKGKIEWIDQHSVEVRLPFLYPDQPPDVRWTSPLFHPNLSFSGFLNLQDVGIPWSSDLSLDAVCERLWDVARMGYIDLERAVNQTARRWVEQECPVDLPVDPRPLRDTLAPPTGTNIVRYKRRGQQRVELAGGGQPDVLFIDEHTAPPPTSTDDDDEVLYIGDD